MTPEAQRVAIAQAARIENVNPVCWRGHLHGVEVSIPDYLNDRDAIIPLITDLTVLQKQTFGILLEEVRKLRCTLARDRKYAAHVLTDLVCTDATTLCQCYLRTIGKWEEPTP